MAEANKFNLLIDVANLMHSLADGLEAVAYAFTDSQNFLQKQKLLKVKLTQNNQQKA